MSGRMPDWAGSHVTILILCPKFEAPVSLVFNSFPVIIHFLTATYLP